MSYFPFLPLLCEAAISFVIHSSGNPSACTSETATGNFRCLFFVNSREQRSCFVLFNSHQCSIQSVPKWVLMPPKPAGGRGGQGRESVKHQGILRLSGRAGGHGGQGEQPVQQDLRLWGPAACISTHAVGKGGTRSCDSPGARPPPGGGRG